MIQSIFSVDGFLGKIETPDSRLLGNAFTIQKGNSAGELLKVRFLKPMTRKKAKKEKKSKNASALIGGAIVLGASASQLKKLGNMISSVHNKSSRAFSEVEDYLTNNQEIPIDITVDLSLIDEKDIEENIETWAYLILLCRNLGNVNFIFDVPDPTKEGRVPDSIDIANAAKAGEVMSLAVLVDMDGGTLASRINIKRNEAIKVPILSKEWLNWMRDEKLSLEESQYPVAMDGVAYDRNNGVYLRNFESALTIGLAKAALAIAKEKDEKKAPEEEKELPTLRKELCEKLQKLYNIVRGDVTLTEETLDNMVHPNSTVRLNLAISLALPPIARMAVEKLKDLHDAWQLLQQAA
ncbi:hypothetical protein ACFL4E_03665 [Candidatus Omnitrophota bacterium]